MELKRLFDVPYYQLKHCPQEKAIGGRNFATGEWEFYSIEEVIELANQVSWGLLNMGVKPGDKIGVAVYKNRPEWCILDIGLSQIGAINVPVYATISSAEYEYIFKEAEVRYVFVGSGDLYDKVQGVRADLPLLEEVFTFDKMPNRPYWREVLRADGDRAHLNALKNNIQDTDLATIIYTSGTTGHPKGVMLSHRNIISNAKSIWDILPIQAGERVLSFLPICHIFERTAFYTFMGRGLNIYFTGTDNLGGENGDLQAVRPHFFTTVPRLLEKVYDRIYAKGSELTGLKKRLFFWALTLTDDYAYNKTFTGLEGLKRLVADRLVFAKWRMALGGCVKGIATGAAKCPEAICRVFSAAGIPVREAYGLTETSPGLTVNPFFGEALLGTVGVPIPGVTVLLAPSPDYADGEGEILAKGDNIMLGYYKHPEWTAEVLDAEGWFHTGDIGNWVTAPSGRKFLKITDRKKELLKTSGGKYVAPAPIESRLKESIFIEQAMVVGEQRKFVAALIVPAAPALKAWCEAQNLPFATLADGTISPETLHAAPVVTLFQKLVDGYNPEFSHTEQIKKFRLVGNNWDVATGELTPTLKLKRRIIAQRHKNLIDDIYEG